MELLAVCQAICRADAVVLDAGCGAGDLSLLLALCGARRVIALDYEPHCVDFAQWLTQAKAGLPNIEVRYGDAGSVEMADGSLDAIFSIEAISHYHDPDAFLNSAARLLRLGGLLFISDGNNGASKRTRAKNQQIWDMFESHKEPCTIHGAPKGPRCYLGMRTQIIREAFPELADHVVRQYAEWTFAMTGEEVQRAVPLFQDGDFTLKAERTDGICPVDPVTNCALEHLFEPRALAERIAQRGFSCRVVSNGPARRDLIMLRLAWEAISPITIRTSRGFSLVCRKNGD